MLLHLFISCCNELETFLIIDKSKLIEMQSHKKLRHFSRLLSYCVAEQTLGPCCIVLIIARQMRCSVENSFVLNYTVWMLWYNCGDICWMLHTCKIWLLNFSLGIFAAQRKSIHNVRPQVVMRHSGTPKQKKRKVTSFTPKILQSKWERERRGERIWWCSNH